MVHIWPIYDTAIVVRAMALAMAIAMQLATSIAKTMDLSLIHISEPTRPY